ncbi:MAG TPA: molybdate ABC transporter substrate-binding protein [Phycisphaerae bacterium]|nr:molybdate ABC transporter substrate-binding protein [Phycisphaerae bacterium]
MRKIFAAAVVMAGVMAGVGRAAFGEATVSAAISLKPALDEAKPLLEKAAGTSVSFNYGASGTLANQIRQGAPVDLFLSADRATAQKLVDSGDGDARTMAVIATGQMVLVVPADNPSKITGFGDLAAKAKKVAIGEPKVVPAGAYAKETLTALKLWDGLDKGGKLVMGENVAQVLAFASRGEVDAALVYATDAKSAGEKVKVVATAPGDSHDAIEYLGVVPKDAPDAQVGAALEKEMGSAEVRAIFAKHGFGAAAEKGAIGGR